MASAVGGIGRTLQQAATLELVEEGHEGAWLDPQGVGEVALRDRSLSVEMVQHREFGPPQPALAEAAPQAPRRGTGKAKDQKPVARDERRVAGFRLISQRCLDGIHAHASLM